MREETGENRKDAKQGIEPRILPMLPKGHPHPEEHEGERKGRSYSFFRLTEYDDHNNLFVTKLSATGFTVQAKETANPAGVEAPTTGASGTFSYRVVAKRKDMTSERLAKVAAPTAPSRPTPFMIPETPVVKAPTKQP